MEIFILPISLCISSLILTYITRIIALNKNVVDVPNARSSHSQPTPRGGGIAIVVTWYIGIIFLYFWGIISSSLLLAFLSGLLLAAIGILDDVFTIEPRYRLIFQLISTGMAVYFLGGLNLNFLEVYPLSIKVAVSLVLILGGIWFINLYNFLDGIDGYASMEAIFVAVALFIFTGNYTTLILMTATLGFLFWNWPKAKIFMGDVGSTQLGFILFVMAVYFHNVNQFSILLWIMLTSLFWFDATFTLFKRWRNGEVLSEAHKKHAYQRIVQSGRSHLSTLLILIGVNVLIFGFTYFSYQYPFLHIPLMILLVSVLFILYQRVDKLVPFTKL